MPNTGRGELDNLRMNSNHHKMSILGVVPPDLT
jgi:hypothetical protein